MSDTIDPRWPRLLAAARSWQAGLIPNTSTGLAAQTRVLAEAIDAFDTVHTVDADGVERDEPLITRTGRILTEAELEAFADEAEAGYEIPVKDPAEMTDDYRKARGVLKGKKPITSRILWNLRPSLRDRGDIDEIVISDCTVHVEQMDKRCWWIGVTRADGGYWAGNFTCDSRGRMRFWEQEMWDFDWDDDDTHEVPDAAD